MRSPQIAELIVDYLKNDVNEGRKDQNVANNGVKGGHSLIERDYHIENSSAEKSHEGFSGDKNNNGGIKVDEDAAAAGDGVDEFECMALI